TIYKMVQAWDSRCCCYWLVPALAIQESGTLLQAMAGHSAGTPRFHWMEHHLRKPCLGQTGPLPGQAYFQHTDQDLHRLPETRADPQQSNVRRQRRTIGPGCTEARSQNRTPVT